MLEIRHDLARILNRRRDERVEQAIVADPAAIHVLTLLQVAARVTPKDMRHVEEHVGGAVAEAVGPQHEAMIREAARLELLEAGCERPHAYDVDLTMRPFRMEHGRDSATMMRPRERLGLRSLER